jgi:tetratricopeptide (TPR) repeat protein
LGLSYLKKQDFLAAQDNFQFILKNFKETKFLQQASLGIADLYLLQQDFLNASQSYQNFIRDYPKSDFLSAAYFGLGRSLLKQGQWQEAKIYLTKVEQDYPLSFEAGLAKKLSSQEFYFTVQVGSFSKQKNAQALCQKLKDNGLDSFLQEETIKDITFYRVRVGKFNSRQQAEDLASQLSQQGYPTKIFP